MRLDAHQHFWRFNQAEYPWMKSGWPIRRNFLPEHLEPLLVQASIDGCIAVQARQSISETSWLLELARDHSFIKGVVGWVDLCSENIEQPLRQFTDDPKFVGVRHVLQDEPEEFMLRPEFQRGIAKLAEFGLTYDLLIFPNQLAAAIELVSRFPKQKFVLDHIAKPDIKSGTISPWREKIAELARFPNVMCKISGMITEANWDSWKEADFAPYLDVVFESFGVERLMFGSDWPVCLLAGSYERVLNLVHRRIAALSAREQEAILGENAEQFYFHNGGELK